MTTYKTITDLEPAALPNLSDEVEVSQGGTSRSITVGQIVQQFGAGSTYIVTAYGIVGDGVTNNASALQTLIDSVTATGGGTIHFPPGVYRLNSQILLKDKIVLTGAGPTQTTLDFSQKGYFQTNGNGFLQSSGGGESNLVSVTANVLAGATAIAVSSIAGYNPGDWCVIRTNELEGAAGTIADICLVEWADSGFIYIQHPIDHTYLIAGHTVSVVKLTTITGGIRDLTVKGMGTNPLNNPSPPYTGVPPTANPLSSEGDRAVDIRYGRNWIIDNVEFVGVEGICVTVSHCIGATVRNSTVRCDAIHCYPQYGIYVFTANINTSIQNNRFYNGRHHITTGFSSPVPDNYFYGSPNGIVISGNHHLGSWLYPIDSHEAAINMTIANNTIESLLGGIEVRGRNVVVSGNTISLPVVGTTTEVPQHGIAVRSGCTNIAIMGNHITGGTIGIQFDSPVTTGSGVAVSGNIIRESDTYGIYVGAKMNYFSVTGNVLQCRATSPSYNSIYMIDCKYGSVTGNTCLLNPASGAAFGVRCIGTVLGDATAIMISSNAVIKVSGAGGSTTGIATDAEVTAVTIDSNEIWTCDTPSNGPDTRVIASDTISVYPGSKFINVDTEGAAAADNLQQIDGGVTGQQMWLYPASASRIVTLKDNLGNLRLAGDFAMTSGISQILLGNRSGTWYELARATV